MNASRSHSRSCGRSFAASILALLLWTMPASVAAQSSLDRPVNQIKTEFGRLLGCKWNRDICRMEGFDGEIELIRDSTQAKVETIEMNPVIEPHPPRPDVRALNRQKVFKVFDYLFPSWKERRDWIDNAMLTAVKMNGRDITAEGDVNILVERLQPQTIEDAYAKIIVTKKKSLEEFITD